MLDPRQLRDLIVRPVLEQLGLYSLAAEQLVMGTAAKESGGLVYIRQHLGEGKHGRGRGLWQVEPETALDLMDRHHRRLVTALKDADRLDPDFLEGDLYLGAALCRLKYLDAPEKLPAAGDLVGMASYWKRFYNTLRGAGRPEEFVASWKACRLDRLYPETR